MTGRVQLGRPTRMRALPGFFPMPAMDARLQQPDQAGAPDAGGQGLGEPQAAGGPSRPTPAPAWWAGTPHEWTVYSWLGQHGVPFDYRGGGDPTGLPGASGDAETAPPAFVLPREGLILEVLGEPTASPGLERLRVAALRSAGHAVVGLDAVDLESDPDGTLTAAVAGVQRSI